MKAVGGVAALAAAAFTFWSGEVEAYRPFDGTDAAVADTGEMEIELGPVETFAREPSARCSLPISGSITGSSPDGRQHLKVNSHMA